MKKDVWGFIQKTPDNYFWAFLNHSTIDIDALDRLACIEPALPLAVDGKDTSSLR